MTKKQGFQTHILRTAMIFVLCVVLFGSALTVQADEGSTGGVRITTTELPVATVGESYSVTLSAEPAGTTFYWNITGLPAGLSASADYSGVISGTPTAEGTYTVSVSVGGIGDALGSATTELTLTVRSAKETQPPNEPTEDIAYITIQSNNSTLKIYRDGYTLGSADLVAHTGKYVLMGSSNVDVIFYSRASTETVGNVTPTTYDVALHEFELHSRNWCGALGLYPSVTLNLSVYGINSFSASTHHGAKVDAEENTTAAETATINLVHFAENSSLTFESRSLDNAKASPIESEQLTVNSATVQGTENSTTAANSLTYQTGTPAGHNDVSAANCMQGKSCATCRLVLDSEIDPDNHIFIPTSPDCQNPNCTAEHDPTEEHEHVFSDCTDASCNNYGCTYEREAATAHLYTDCTSTVCENDGCTVEREGMVYGTHSFDGCTDTSCNRDGCLFTRTAQNDHSFDHCCDVDCNSLNCNYSREHDGHIHVGTHSLADGEYLDTEGNVSTTKPEGGYAYFSIDAQTGERVLILHNYSYTGDGFLYWENGVYTYSALIYSRDDLTVLVEGTVALNVIEWENDGIASDGKLTLKGSSAQSSTLTIYQADTGIYAGEVWIESLSLHVIDVKYGISAHDGGMTVTDAKIFLNDAWDGIDVYGENSLLIQNSEIVMNEVLSGIFVDYELIAYNSVFRLFTGDEAIYSNGRVSMLDCIVEISSLENVSIFGSEYLSFTNCVLDIFSSGNAIVSEYLLMMTDTTLNIVSYGDGVVAVEATVTRSVMNIWSEYDGMEGGYFQIIDSELTIDAKMNGIRVEILNLHGCRVRITAVEIAIETQLAELIATDAELTSLEECAISAEYLRVLGGELSAMIVIVGDELNLGMSPKLNAIVFYDGKWTRYGEIFLEADAWTFAGYEIDDLTLWQGAKIDGILTFDSDALSAEEIRALGLTGNGIVMVGDERYTTAGEPLPQYVFAEELDFSEESGEVRGEGYVWDGETKTLTLTDAMIEATLILPDGEVTLVLHGRNYIAEIKFTKHDTPTTLTILGDGSLELFEEILEIDEWYEEYVQIHLTVAKGVTLKLPAIDVTSLSVYGTLICTDGSIWVDGRYGKLTVGAEAQIRTNNAIVIWLYDEPEDHVAALESLIVYEGENYDISHRFDVLLYDWYDDVEAWVIATLRVTEPKDGYDYYDMSFTPTHILAHTHEYESNCDAICDGCEEARKPTAEHSFGAWNVTAEPTETEQGSRERICDACGHVEVEAIAILSPADDEASADDEAPADDGEETKEGLPTGAVVAITLGATVVGCTGLFSLFWFGIRKKSFADLIGK